MLDYGKMNQQFMIVKKGSVESATEENAPEARENPHLYSRMVFDSIEAAADQIEQRVLQDCYIIQLPFPVLINDERGGIYPKRVKDFLDDSEV